MTGIAAQMANAMKRYGYKPPSVRVAGGLKM